MVLLEQYDAAVLVLTIAAVSAAVHWFALRDRGRHLSPEQRIGLILIYMGGGTLLFDVVFYYFLRRDLGSDSVLLFLPIAVFTAWMAYAMMALTRRIRREAAGGADSPSWTLRFSLKMVVFAAFTGASLAYAVFYS